MNNPKILASGRNILAIEMAPNSQEHISIFRTLKNLCKLDLQGRLVNIQNYSLNTIASVIKKFLRKIPGGIFGPENEKTIFNIVKMEDNRDQMKAVYRLMKSLPLYSQHLLVLLFGTFRVIATNSVVNETNMTAQALGVR